MSNIEGWYHSGGGIKLEEFEGFGAALVTSPHRSSFLYGPVVFLDTRCIAQIGDIIEFEGKVTLLNDDGQGSAVCNPSNPHTVMRCPSASIIVSRGGYQTAAYWDFAQVHGNWSVTGWNIISGNVEVDEVLAAADSLAILLTRCRKTVRIALNDVSAKIKQPDRTCKDLLRNGFFENNAISGWSVMGESVKTAVNDGVLFLSGREKWYHGIAQILNPSCLKVGSQLEVHAKVQLLTQERFVSCEPGRLYLSSESCPNMNLRIQNQNGTEKFVEIGRTVGQFLVVPVLLAFLIVEESDNFLFNPFFSGPYKKLEWNIMYGIFTVTKEMVESKRLLFYINRAWENVNMNLSNIKMIPVTENTLGLRNCNQLIRNYDARNGNAAFWAVNGASAAINITRIGDYPYFHFVHRTEWFHSIFQDIEKSCLTVGSTWRMESSIRLLESASGKAYHCEKQCDDAKCLASIGRCPWFQLTLESPSKKDFLNLWDENPAPWKKHEFNTIYVEAFTVKESLLKYENIYVSVTGPKGGVDMMIDYIKVTKASMGGTA